MHRVFGQFLDDAVNIPLDKISCEFVASLIPIMSQSFQSTQTRVATESKLWCFGATSDGGSNRGHESSLRAFQFRRLLLGYLKSLFPSLDLGTLDPAQPDQAGDPPLMEIDVLTTLVMARLTFFMLQSLNCSQRTSMTAATECLMLEGLSCSTF